MFNPKVIKEALKRTWAWNSNPDSPSNNLTTGEDKEISLLIHDVFGGDILKTPKRKGWHFYNRINGERLDFSNSELGKLIKGNRFKDIPVSPEEATLYFDQADYSNFYMQFIRAFEEILGLKKHRTRYSTG